MANTPAFATTPILGLGRTATANTARDGTGTYSTIVTGAATGTKIFELVCEFTVTTTAGNVKWAISNDTGTTKFLFDEWTVAAVTVSASVSPIRLVRTYDNLVLPSAAYILYAAPEKAEQVTFFAFGASL